MNREQKLRLKYQKKQERRRNGRPPPAVVLMCDYMLPILFIDPTNNNVISTFHVGIPERGHTPPPCPPITGIDDIFNPAMFQATSMVRHSSDIFLDTVHPFCALHVIYKDEECLIIHPHLLCAMFLVMEYPKLIPTETKEYIESASDKFGIGSGYITYKACLPTYKYTHTDAVKRILAPIQVIVID
jgi:hypothetical protein